MRTTVLVLREIRDSAGPPYHYATFSAVELDTSILPVGEVVCLSKETAEDLRDARDKLVERLEAVNGNRRKRGHK